jgi:DNA-binding IscR family transcriptional regulator
MTSEDLAERLQMNPVVLRRTLSALRRAGILTGDKGHGGGWQVAAEVDRLSLFDVMGALDNVSLFAIGPRNERTGCPIERAVDRSVAGVLAEAEVLVGERLRAIPVASLLANARGKRGGHRTKEVHDHA